MTIGKGYLKGTGVLALVTVIVALILWTGNMYRSSIAIYLQTADKCLRLAGDEELNKRMFSLGDDFTEWFTPYTDASAYVNKTIQFKDTTYHVRIRKDDPTAFTKIRQFYMQFILPLNAVAVDSIFRRYIVEHSLMLESSYVEYWDLKNDTLLASNAPKGKLSGYIASNTDTLDIFKTIAVRAYVKTPVRAVVRPVMEELAVSFALVIIALCCMVKLTVDLFRMHKAGFRVLRAVSQKAERSLTKAAGQVEATTEKLRIKNLEEESAELEKVSEGLIIDSGYFERLRMIIKNEEGKIKFKKTTFRIKPLLYELKGKYEQIIRKNVFINIKMNDAVFIHTDEYYLRRILEELLDNSVTYSNDPVEILIVVAQNGEKTIVVVCNTGWGLVQEDLDNLYIVNHDIAKLYNEAVKKDTKTGLGLSFVYSFVRSLGGKVKVESEENIAGVKMVFYLEKDDLKKINRAKREYQKGLTVNKPFIP